MKNQLSKYMKFTEENKKHWVFRCPYCGDSKIENHGHLNVSKNMPVFRCVRCGQGGHIKQLLDHLNANDVILPEYINDGKYTKKKHKTNIISFKEQIEPYVEEYIKKRLNIKNIPNELNILPTTVLHKMIKNISYKSLSQALKELEADDLIIRREYPQIPPKVEYSLTPKGISLIPIMEAMCEWGKKNRPDQIKSNSH